MTYSFGEKGMQLDNHRNFSVLLFLEHGNIGMHACELGLCCYFLVTLKNDVCTVTMGVVCSLLRRSCCS